MKLLCAIILIISLSGCSTTEKEDDGPTFIQRVGMVFKGAGQGLQQNSAHMRDNRGETCNTDAATGQQNCRPN